MNAVAVANLLGVAAALAVSVSAALWSGDEDADQTTLPARHAGVELVERDGERGLIDAGGHFLALRDFKRIVSVDLVADDLLYALCEPERIVAFSAYAKNSALGYRFGDRGLSRTTFDPETLLALKPDLILVNNLSRQDRIARMRESGTPVFDLGEMRGLSTLIPNIHSVALLLGHPEAGQRLAHSLSLRMEALSAMTPPGARRAAVYVGIHGDKLYGGSQGTSFADVLDAAGLSDAAAAAGYTGWPRYTSEQLLILDPEVVVTQDGMARVLCRHPGLHALRACQPGGQIVEVDAALMQDPGLELVLAAEEVHRELARATKSTLTDN